MSDNENFCSTTLQPFQFEPEINTVRKKLNIFMLQLLIYYILDQGISIDANVDIAKVKEKKQIVFVDAMLITLAKILECKGRIFPSSFYGQLSNYQPYLHVDEFLLFLLELNKVKMLDEFKSVRFLFITPWYQELNISVMNVGSQSRQSQIESYGQPIFIPFRISGGMKF